MPSFIKCSSTLSTVSVLKSHLFSYLTDLKELLYQFNFSKSDYFYLTESGNINGLVSQVNLNSKPVYTYFYNLLSNCEIELGLWVKSLIKEDEIISLISNKSNQSSKDLSFEAFERYSYDKKNNTQNHIVEYVYFTQFEYILKKKKLVSTLGYQSNSDVLVSNYGMDNPQEFFAEAFMIYWNPNFNNPNVMNPETGEPQYKLPASVEAKLDSYFKY